MVDTFGDFGDDFTDENWENYAAWFTRMMQSENVNTVQQGVEASHITNTWDAFVKDRLLQERGVEASPSQLAALDIVRREFLDVDVIAGTAGRGAGTRQILRDIGTGRFVGIRDVVGRITGRRRR